jgi:uncharacterized membrane protein YoaK (UPF0700 family)
MPIPYLRTLASRDRTQQADARLGRSLAFVAGAVNAGGFLAVQQYTSHMTGIVSSIADHIVLLDAPVVLSGLGGLAAFIAGAGFTAILINWGRRHELHSEYASPLMVEAILLICLGLLGPVLARLDGPVVPAAVALLCFIMGLQNAIITKISQARIRTTHLTGMITDIGIELGKLAYWNGDGSSGRPPVVADQQKLRLLASLVLMFFTGGVIGALGFSRIGFSATLPLAALVLFLAVVPVLDDVARLLRRR